MDGLEIQDDEAQRYDGQYCRDYCAAGRHFLLSAEALSHYRTALSSLLRKLPRWPQLSFLLLATCRAGTALSFRCSRNR